MNLERVGPIVTDLVEADCLPKVIIKEGSPLGAAIAAIAGTSTRKPEETDTQAAERWLSDFASHNNSIVETQIDEISKVLISGMQGSIRTIKSLHTTVTDICGKVDSKVDVAVGLDPKLAHLVNTDNSEVSYVAVDFTPLNSLGSSSSLTGAINEFIGADESSPRLAFNGVMERYVQMKSSVATADIVLKDEDKVSIIDAINKSTSTHDKDTISDLVGLLTSTNRIQVLKNNCVRTVSSAANVTSNMMEALRVVSEYAKLLPIVQTKLLDLGYEEIVSAGNFIQVSAVLETYHYFINYHRESTFANTILFNNNMLNPDMEEAGKIAGISNADLGKYVQTILNGKLVLDVGLLLTTAQQAKAIVDKKFAEERSADDMYVRLTVGRLRKTALVNNLYSFLEDKKVTTQKYIDGRADELIRTDIPLEDLVYDILIKCLYPNSIIGTLHNYMGKAFASAIVDNPELDAATINSKTIDSYLEVITDLLAKKILR